MDERHSVFLDQAVSHWDAGRTDQMWMPAQPDETYAALKAVTPREVHLFRPLIGLRMLPGLLVGKKMAFDSDRPLLEGFLRKGFVELAEAPPHEYLIGGIGQFWRLWDNMPVPLADAREFHEFAEPGYCKAYFDFTVVPDGEGSRLRSEIRMVGTSRAASFRFRFYWIGIAWISRAIRRSALRAIHRRLRQPRDVVDVR